MKFFKKLLCFPRKIWVLFILLHAFFSKQHLYKQGQTDISKKSKKN